MRTCTFVLPDTDLARRHEGKGASRAGHYARILPDRG